MAEREPNPYQWRFFLLGFLCLIGTLVFGLRDDATYRGMTLPLSIFGSTAFALGTWIHIKS